MLDILKQDAAMLGIKNRITTHQSKWEDFCTNQSHDIAIASMTPAISSKAHFEKMIKSTNGIGIYVGWGAYKTNELLDTIIEAHPQMPQIPQKNFSGCMKTTEIMKILNRKKMPFETITFTTSWKEDYDYARVISYINDNLLRKEIAPHKNLINKILVEHTNNDKITFETKAEKRIILWKRYKISQNL
ncbi:MAG: hypothetical protein PHE73_00065 [Sulfurovaceae bacterium]|nr:hypothetical protein [Sulfurovaceae bacterium]